MRRTILSLTLFAMATASQAQVTSQKNISLTLANDIALRAVEACAANGYNVTATVVDRAGQVKAVSRADNAGPHTLDSARRKAYTSASAKSTTTAVMETAQKSPAAQNIAMIDGFLLLGGGVPIKVGNEVIGAIGVGGAPGGNLDEQCAMAALEKVKAKLQ